MKISIVIPCLNEEKYLPETLQAVTRIDYPNYEVIVADSNSVDKSIEVAKKFAGVKVVHAPTKGTQFAREAGRQAARGEILAFLDADCKPDRDWLKKALHYFKNPRVVALGGPYDYYDGGTVFRLTMLVLQKLLYVPTNILLRIFHTGGILVGGNMLVRANALEKIGGLDTSYTFWGDDTDTARRLSKIGKVVFAEDFIMKSSARRFKIQGSLKTVIRYIYYFFKTILLPKAKTSQKEALLEK